MLMVHDCLAASEKSLVSLRKKEEAPCWRRVARMQWGKWAGPDAETHGSEEGAAFILSTSRSHYSVLGRSVT